MALTRKFLSAMGIEADKVDQIIEAHSETVEALKKERDGYKDDAGKLAGVQKELDDLKADIKDKYIEKAEYDKKVAEFNDYKSGISAKEAQAAKEKAAKAYFESKNITGNNLNIALRSAKDEINALELDGEKIKDATALDGLIAGDLKSLVVKGGKRGADIPNPPGNNGGTNGPLTREEIYAKDEHGHYKLSAAERQDALIKATEARN